MFETYTRCADKPNILTPFMGVGSEVHEAVRLGRRGIGIELKESYYRQSRKNLQLLEKEPHPKQSNML